MSRYGNGEKDYLFNEMCDFVNETEDGLCVLLSLVADVVSDTYWNSVQGQVAEYEKYKIKCEQIEGIVKDK